MTNNYLFIRVLMFLKMWRLSFSPCSRQCAECMVAFVGLEIVDRPGSRDFKINKISPVFMIFNKLIRFNFENR
jgi:hypothetical protein